MLKTKKLLSSILAASMLFTYAGAMSSVQAEDYVYPDTVAVVEGIEVIGSDNKASSVPHWLKTYQGDSNSKIYLTHEAYEGNGAMLVIPSETGTSWPANTNLEKAGATADDKDKIIVGDTYKVEYYQKPIALGSKGTYELAEIARYYNNYDTFPVKFYDAATGELAPDPAKLESKWYRIEGEFTAIASNLNQNVGLAFAMRTTSSPYLVDEVKIYHKVNDEWVLMKEATGVRNGGFEEGVTAIKGVNPTDVTATAGISSAVISWTNPQNQQTKIYNGDELVATAEAGVSSVTMEGLTNGVEYTFTLKGVFGGIESDGVDVKVTPKDAKYPDTIGVIDGVEVFNESPVHWLTTFQGAASKIYLTHEAYRGESALLIKSSAEGTSFPSNYELTKDGENNADADKVIEGDEYKIVFYEKPLAVNDAGDYALANRFRYYNDYNVYWTNVFDAENGNLVVEGSNAPTSAIESKWYRCEGTFTANAANVNNWVGFALLLDKNHPLLLIDNVEMYHKVNGEWILMKEGTGVRNGNFEEGVESTIGLDPIDVKVENKTESVTVSWTNPREQQTRIYNGDELLATAEIGVSSVTLENLIGNKEYSLTLKGVGTQKESNGVNVIAYPFPRQTDTKDIISGVEVFDKGAANWLTTYQGKAAEIYITHEAYEGNGALLIKSPTEGTAFPANNGLSKANAANSDADKIIEGDSYKVVFYEKPLEKNNEGKYVLSRRFRYYNLYDVYFADAYDAETGSVIAQNDNKNDPTVVDESKWYRCEKEFTAVASNAGGDVGFALTVPANHPTLLIDNVEMYHKVDGEWVLMKDATGVRNGNFEEGVTGDNTAPYEVENFKATEGNTKAVLLWDAIDMTEVPDFAGYELYNGSTKIANIERNITSYTVEGLTNDTEYTFTIKAFDRFGNISEGTTITVVPTIPKYETGEYVMGSKLVQGKNSVSVKVTNNKFTDGLNTQLILGLFDTQKNTLIKAAASSVEVIAQGQTADVRADITVDDLNAGNFELRAYLWETLDSVSPLKESAAIGE